MNSTARLAERPLLIIDKKGLFGIEVASYALQKVLLVSRALPRQANIYHIPYIKTIPQLPLLPYSGLLLIYSNEEVFALLPELGKKAKEDDIPLFFVLQFDQATPEVISRIHKIPYVTIVILGQLFGKLNKDWKIESPLNSMFTIAVTKRRILLREWGMRTVLPVFTADAARVLLDLVTHPPKAKVLLLFPKHGMSELSFAHMLQKADPLIDVDFTKETTQQAPRRLPAGVHVFPENYDLGAAARHVLREAQKDFVLQKTVVVPKSKKKVIKHKAGKEIMWFMIGSVVCIIFLPLFVYIGSFLVGAGSLLSVKQSMESGKMEHAASAAQTGKTAFALSGQAGLVIALEAGFFDQADKVAFLLQKSTSGEQASIAVSQLITAYAHFQGVQTTKGDAKGEFVAGLDGIKTAFDTIQKIEAAGDVPSGILSKLISLTPVVNFIKTTSDVLPSVIGFDHPKQYLVLFQNNTELRPTGGFIGSYGLVTVSKGKLVGFTVHDVYDADGQLKQHIEPPYPLRRYLTTKDLYLRDSNFDIDYPTSASVSASLLYLETKQKVDGVIAVDLSFVKTLLEATGPITLPDYKTTVDASNFYLQTETHAEKNFFPGSTQKKDFLRALFGVLEEKLLKQHSVNYVTLAKGFGDALVQKHMLFAFQDASEQNLFTVNNYAGAVWDDRTPQDRTVNDFVGLNEANIGINKANYFLKRKTALTETIAKNGTISARYTIYYKNDSTSWPGGDYKEYVRVLLPQGAQLMHLVIDGKEQTIIPAQTDYSVYEDAKFVPPQGVEVWKQDVLDKSVYGFLLVVPKGPYKSVSLVYTLPSPLVGTEPDFTYALRLFKQPGTDADPYSVTVTYPSTYQLLTHSSGQQINGNEVSFSDTLLHDTDITLRFVKK